MFKWSHRSESDFLRVLIRGGRNADGAVPDRIASVINGDGAIPDRIASVSIADGAVFSGLRLSALLTEGIKSR
ncbi:MAG: hypothetical protein LBL42_05305, partial [Tannerella sp.]|nr:hypothetical protein [Tannerella sp.]